MNDGYCGFFLRSCKKCYPDVEHCYIIELKNASRKATDKVLEVQAEEGRNQLLPNREDKAVRCLAGGTTLHRLLLQFRGWDLVRCEEV